MSAVRKPWLRVSGVLLGMALAAPVAAAPRGSLKIESSTLGARVKVDGRSVGVVPLKKPLSLRAGRHRLVIEKPGYRRITMVVLIRPGRQVKRTIHLVAVAGVLAIRSTPTGAQVKVDGRELGQTPIEGAEVSPGRRDVEATLAGYHLWSKQLEVEAGKTYQFRALLEADPDAPVESATDAALVDPGDPFAIMELEAVELEPAEPMAVAEVDPFALVDLEPSGVDLPDTDPVGPMASEKVAPAAALEGSDEPGFTPDARRPVWRRWWVWTAVGVLLTTGITTAVAAGAPPRKVLDCSPLSGVDAHLGLAGCGR